MQASENIKAPALPPAPMPDAPTDPYVAGLWQQWRAQLRLTMKTPWLATKWLEESRKLLARATRIYTHLCRQPRPIRRRLQRQLGASLAGVALALALANAPVQAADFTANDAASLIAAINNANNETTNPGPDTITLTGDVTLTAGNSYTYFSQTGLPLISSQITIEGAGHTIARDAGAPNFRLLTVNASGNLTLHQVTLTGGKSNSNGADGGGIYNRGTLTVSDSTLSGNHTYGYGGGIINRGTATLSNSTLSGNSASSGGGIRNNGTVTVNNSTLSGNSASFQGGGIFNNHDYTITLVRSLITGNSAPNGAELFNAPYWPAPSPHQPSMPGGTVYANNFNLIGYGGNARSDNFTPSGSDIVPSVGLSAILGPLADNGGATLTHALVSGSPAINAAGDSGLATDQRGVARPQGAADDIGAFEVEVAAPNAQLNGSDCDLIDAIIAANTDTATGNCNAGSGADTITLLSDVTLMAGNANVYSSATGLPLISSQITIEGAGYTIARDAGTPNFRLLAVNASGNLTLHQVTLTGGKSSSNGADGGGIYNRGTVTVSDSTLSGNHTYGTGGGIYNKGTVTVSNSTLSGNSANNGGGILNYGTVTVSNSTLSGNSASFNGGGIFNNTSSTITLVRSLITGNSAPNGAELFNVPYRAGNSFSPPSQAGTVNANNFNLIGYGGDARSYSFTPSGSDIVPSVALAAILDTTLADNGGPSTGSGTGTLTHALVSGSPALDAAGDSGLATDQRGVTRPQGAADDIGAFEVEVVAPPNAQINGSDCDLIDAIIAANTDTASGDCNAGSGADTITLLSDVTLTTSNVNVYSSDTGLPLISSEITIEGAGYTIARDAGAPAFRLLAVGSSGNLTLNTVTLSGGNSQSHGGAIYNRGAVTVANSTLSANNTNLSGGAINNRGTMTVNNSTLSGNASGSGGAIKNRGTVTLSNSTISGNSAGSGGAFYNDGTVTLSNSTVSGNSASTGGAFYITAGTVTLNRSLISGNQADNGAEIYNFGSVNAANFNLIGYGGDARSENFTPSGSDIVPSVGLSAILDTTLADNGGPSTGSGTATLTHALVSGSPAIDAAGDSGLATDQRGVTRPQGAADDIGAFEVEVAAAPEIDITGNGVSIVSGDNEPDPADHTNFGSADIDGGTVVRTFTIHNTGDGDLTLSGSPLVAVSGASAFSVTSQPASSTIAAGESTTFEITFDPSTSDLHIATVTIASDDSDESPYTFTIGGIGSERLLPNTQIAAAGAATQSCATGSAGYVYDCTVTFNLRNVAGDAMLIGHYRVNSISTHAEVLNGEPAAGQAGTIVQAGELVNPDGTFQPEFVVGLKTAARYSIRFSVFGVANSGVTSASADAGATGEELVELGTFDITFDPTAEPGAEGQSFQLYLPTVVNQ